MISQCHNLVHGFYLPVFLSFLQLRGSNKIFFFSLLAAKSDESCSVQLIDGDGGFNVDGIDSFIKDVKLGECGLSYAVVSIMGPQSSGKESAFRRLSYL